jgi:hypothetical protein
MEPEVKAAPKTESVVAREEIAKAYDSTVNQPVEVKPEPAPAEAEPVVELPEAAVKVEVKEAKQSEAPDWKAATYEERMKRKAETDARKRAEDRVTALEAKIKQFETQEPSAEITDYDKELMDLKRRQRAIEELEQERVERERQEATVKVSNKIATDIDQAHKDLVTDGYPGFKHAIGSVTRELQRLVAEDDSNIHLDSPSGWKKIYKEVIYPELKAEFESVSKQNELDAKRNLKQSANLASSSGKAPVKSKSDEPLSPEEEREKYFRMRRGA